MKIILAVIAGLIAGILTIFIVESLAHILYPLPTDLDLKNPEVLKMYINNAPVGSLLMVLLAYATGSFVTGLVSTLVIKKASLRPALTAGAVLMAFGIVNMLTIPHPVWFWALSILVYLPFSYLGYKVVKE